MGEPITSLLVPLDGSDRAERAIRVAERLRTLTGAPITLLHWTVDDKEAAAVAERMNELADGLGSTDVLVELNDDLVGTIEGAAAERSATVCMGTHGRSGLVRAALGSVAEDVLRRARQPMVLVGPNAEPNGSGPVGRIVVGFDGSTAAERTLPIAAAWASQLEADVELVHAVEPDLDERLEEHRGDVVDSSYLMNLVKRVEPSRPTSYEVLYGDPSEAIAGYATDGVELVALSTHGRSGLDRLALGSVTMGVAHRARRPVLVVPRT